MVVRRICYFDWTLKWTTLRYENIIAHLLNVNSTRLLFYSTFQQQHRHVFAGPLFPHAIKQDYSLRHNRRPRSPTIEVRLFIENTLDLGLVATKKRIKVRRARAIANQNHSELSFFIIINIINYSSTWRRRRWRTLVSGQSAAQQQQMRIHGQNETVSRFQSVRFLMDPLLCWWRRLSWRFTLSANLPVQIDNETTTTTKTNSIIRNQYEGGGVS